MVSRAKPDSLQDFGKRRAETPFDEAGQSRKADPAFAPLQLRDVLLRRDLRRVGDLFGRETSPLTEPGQLLPDLSPELGFVAVHRGMLPAASGAT